MKFKSLITNLIMEQGRYEILVKTFTKSRKKKDKVIPPVMNIEELNQLVLADPTTRQDDGNIKKAGKYANWIIKNFVNKFKKQDDKTDEELKAERNLFFEDLYKTNEDLQKFDRFKSRLTNKDINSYNFESLYDAVKDFDLTMAQTTKSERKTSDHPGGEVVHDGSQWKVIKISDEGQLGKEAACHYGGQNKETRWCTSAPGLSYFERYIKDGPLYVLLDKSDTETGSVTGLPKRRYQFHFPSQQYMDIDDRQIDLVKFLSENDELKPLFKSHFAEGLTNSKQGKSVSVEYPRDNASKYIALYGFDDFFKNLPDDLQRLDFIKSNRGYYGRQQEEVSFEIPLPADIDRFKNLDALHLEGIVSQLPDTIGNLKNLMFLSLPNNPKLTDLPDSIADLENLQVLNLKGSGDIRIPERLQNRIDTDEDLFVFRDA
jgi:hypothetical protein